MDLDLKIKIIQTVINAIVPIVIFIFGYAINKSIEKFKIVSLKKHNWEVKWADVFFESFKNYQSYVVEYLTILRRLHGKSSSIDKNEAQKLEKRKINLLSQVHDAGYQCYLHASILVNNEKLNNSINELYGLILNWEKGNIGHPEKIVIKLLEVSTEVKNIHNNSQT